MTPKVTIILPCYNVELYLERAVESIKKQSFTNYEAIFVNDGSTDNIVERFKNLKLDSRFKLYSKENQGSGFARNYGLSLSQGEYVYFMDPDDMIDDNLLEDNLKILEEKKSDLIIFGYRTINDENGKIIKNYIPKAQGDFYDIQLELIDLSTKVNIASIWNKIYRKSFLVENSLLFSDLVIGQDYVFNLDVLDYAEKITVVSRVYYSYYVNRNGSVRTDYNSKQFESEKNILKTMKNKFEKWEIKDNLAFYLNDYLVNIVMNEIINLNKINYTYEKLSNDLLYRKTLKISLNEVISKRAKFSLILIKNPMLLRLYLKLFN